MSFYRTNLYQKRLKNSLTATRKCHKHYFAASAYLTIEKNSYIEDGISSPHRAIALSFLLIICSDQGCV